MHVGPGEVVACGGLWIGAFILAADVGLRMAPELRERFGLTGLLGSGYWGFTPLVLFDLTRQRGAAVLACATCLGATSSEDERAARKEYEDIRVRFNKRARGE